MFATLVDRLRTDSQLDDYGRVKLTSGTRAERTLVYAALLRGVRVSGMPIVSADRLVGWLLVDRDAEGSFGSPESTLGAVQALLASGMDVKGETTVTIDGIDKPTIVGPNARVAIPLPPNTSAVDITTKGPWLIARLERPRVRLFSHPDFEQSPLRLDIWWPAQIKRGVATLHVNSVGTGPTRIDVPLPPGVSLAAPMKQLVRQMQGHLVITMLSDGPADIPLRFGLAGTFTAREARITSPSVAIRGVAAARTITVSD
jgi:hypothetical protein